MAGCISVQQKQQAVRCSFPFYTFIAFGTQGAKGKSNGTKRNALRA